MRLRIAFAGFRHVHMLQFYALALRHAGVEVAAAAEDDKAAADAAAAQGVRLTHPGVDALLEDAAGYDVLAVGETYGRRAGLALRGLAAGKHLMIDKPPCTRLEDLERIAAAARGRGLKIGCLLDLRDSGPIRGLRREVRALTIGRVHSVVFMGQHPLMYGTRPAWYFEAGQHGGTLNDIAIHALDGLPWLLGSPVAEIVAARTWNSRLAQHPDFEVGAQLMVRLADGTGCIGDVSYLAPDSQGYTVPTYWRFTLAGERGTLEAASTSTEVLLWKDGDKSGRTLAPEPARTGGVLDDFLADVGGRARDAELTTEGVLASARVALLAQRAAATGGREPVGEPVA
jgi:predicted dehydrogenase